MNIRLNNKTVFLLDGCGAVISSLFLGVVLPALNARVGMPLHALYGLAALALSFAAYSLWCYHFANHNEPKWLRTLISLNLSYCSLSLFLLVRFWPQLQPLGIAYFLCEKLIVLGLVRLEHKVLKSLTSA